MKNESFRRSFSMLCAAVGLIVLMGIAVAGQMESTEQQNQKLLSENQKLTEENERLEKDLNNWKIAKEIKEAPAVRLKEDSENWMLMMRRRNLWQFPVPVNMRQDLRWTLFPDSIPDWMISREIQPSRNG